MNLNEQIFGPRDFQTIGDLRAMAALDELLEEMQSTWTSDGKHKHMIIERSQLEQALLSEAVRQLKPGPILRVGAKTGPTVPKAEPTSESAIRSLGRY